MARTYVIGDPQAPFAKVREVLASHGALAGDRLAADVHLISIGDHFDYDFRDPSTCAREGLAVLRWLTSHDPSQVTVLFGNHDAARVMELAMLDDAEFERARQLARSIDDTAKADVRAAAARERAEFLAAYPALPSSGVIGRDYASFTTEQRALVIELLLAGRFQLATVGTLLDGREVLLTHAGVTSRELALLGHAEAHDPATIAGALQAFFAAAIADVAPAWRRGELAPLSLAPLHVMGAGGEEGGGLLYHRPTNPESSQIDARWAADSERPRRFDPRNLPLGLTQIVGHTGHAKCTAELAAWASDAAFERKHGGIRTLRVCAGRGATVHAIRYDLGVAPPADGTADMIFVDGELRRVPAGEVALLELVGR